MPPLATPPNPVASPPPETPPSSGPRVRAGRYGELEQHELLQLLDTIDDERSRSRFREAMYISVLIYVALGWFVFYGPRVLLHQGRLILPSDVLKQREKELTYLNLPKDVSKLPPPKTAKAISDHSSVAQTSHPTLDRKTLEQLQAMRGAADQARPTPLPPAPAPQAQPPAPQQAPPPPPTQAPPTPLPQLHPVQPQVSSVPDAPRPNFSVPQTAGRAMQDVTRGALQQRGLGGEGEGTRTSHQGANTGLEVLSDTLGVDFGPYIKRLLLLVKAAWYPLIPEETRPPLNKEGTTLIRFRIEPDGRVSYMHLDDSTHDQAIDRAAWGGITGVGQFPPLPPEFKGPNLDLRIQFIISHHYASDQ